MNADHFRRKARHFLTLAQQSSRLEERAVMIARAAAWMERAERAERIVQQQQPVQPEPEPSRKLVSQS
jgi:hypothetical protein